jgi:hypothetical protein
MSTEFDGFAACLAQSLSALSLRAEEEVLYQLISAGDTYCTYHFEVDAQTLRALVAVFQEDAQLRTDLQNAVAAHRPDRHWKALVEHVYEIANLNGQLHLLGLGFSFPRPEDRRRLANSLNYLDGEIAARHVLADRRNLAERVNKAAGYPVIDGLTMRGLTFVLAEHPNLWRGLQELIEPSLPATEPRNPGKQGCP